MNKKERFMIKILYLLVFIFATKNSYSFSVSNCINGGSGGNCSIQYNENNDYVGCSGDGYFYTSDGNRILCADKDLPSDLDNGFKEGISKISNIPVIGQLLNLQALMFPYIYIFKTIEIAGSDLISGGITGLVTGDAAGVIIETTMFLANMLTIFDSDDINSSGFVSFGQVYDTNQYCQYQNFYMEESKYITRQELSSGGGYPVYPIYPMDISIVDNQCNYYGAVARNFKKPSDSVGTLFGLRTNTTKCSYAYSPTKLQCINLDIPIFATYIGTQTAAEIACAIFSYKRASGKYGEVVEEAIDEAKEEIEERVKKEIREEAEEAVRKEFKDSGKDVSENSDEFKEALEKKFNELFKDKGQKKIDDGLNEVGENAMQDEVKKNNKRLGSEIAAGFNSVASAFVDPRLSYDPVSLKNILDFEQGIDIVIGLFGGDYFKPLPLGISCLISRYSVLAATLSAYQGVANNDISSNYNKAVEGLKEVRFCGQDWLSYDHTDDGKYYVKGPYSNSRFKMVNDCINSSSGNGNNECDKINESVCDETDKNFCLGINKRSKDIRNKIYREFLYSGREYESSIVERNISKNIDDNRSRAIDYDIDYCIDPRLPKVKGYSSLMQRYYMKGNDKANFACSRFIYDGKSGCILPEKDVIAVIESIKNDVKDDDPRYAVISNKDSYFGSDSIINDNGNKFYIINSSKNDKDETIFNMFNSKCSEVFLEARKCCKYRSQHMFCLESISADKKNVDYKNGKEEALTNIKVINNSFCFSNVINSYSESSNLNLTLADFISTVNSDASKVTCEIKGEKNTYKFEGTKKFDTNYICVFSEDLCPYNFKLNSGLNYRASYCDSNYFEDTTDYDSYSDFKRDSTHLNAATCREGIFGLESRERYKKLYSSPEAGSFIFDKVKNDMSGYNDEDFTTIYDFGKLSEEEKEEYLFEDFMKLEYNGFYFIDDIEEGKKLIKPLVLRNDIANRIKTRAYGQTKNFCQYRAHCVEVEKEEERDVTDSIVSTFLDSSCNSSSTNSRNVQRSSDGTILRQLSVPIVECIHESLNNLINGVNGISSCKNGEPNVYGYCGSDTEEEVKKNLKALQNGSNESFFKDKYNFIQRSDGSVLYLVKGETLPDEYNPFLKIQNNFKDIIRIALTVFLVIFGYKMLISGDMEKIVKADGGEIQKLILFIFKFTVVLFLIFNNGWQKGVYTYIVNFATAGYDFVNNLFSDVVNSPKNKVLNLDGNIVLKLVEVNNITNEEKNVSLCYRYNAYNKVDYRIRNNESGGCGSGGFRSKIGTYEIDIKENGDFPNQNESNLIISTNKEIQQLLYVIENYNRENAGSTISIRYRTKDDENWVNSLANSPMWNSEYDGCYFDSSEYKYGKNYLAFFDTIDCKMTKYLGFSSGNIVPNLIVYSAIFFLPQYFFPNNEAITNIVSTLGSFVFGLMMTFVFLMFNVIVKAAYTFLSSFFVLSILIFISPIVLPLMFFDKTKKIYDNWLQNVVGVIFKPMFNLAFLILYINIMDVMLLSDVTFSNHTEYGRDPTVICSDKSFSFYCVVNKNIVEAFDLIGSLFSGYLSLFLFNVVIAFLFLKLADKFMDELESIISKIFSSLTKESSGMTSLGGAAREGGFGTGDAYNSAKDFGASVENFRSEYIQGGMYAASATVGKGIKAAARGIVDAEYYFKNNNKSIYTDYKHNKNQWLSLFNEKRGLINSNREKEEEIKRQKEALLSASKEDRDGILSNISSLEDEIRDNKERIVGLNERIEKKEKELDKNEKMISEANAKKLKYMSNIDGASLKALTDKTIDKIADSALSRAIANKLTIFKENLVGEYTLIGRLSKRLPSSSKPTIFGRYTEKYKISLVEEIKKLQEEIAELEGEIDLKKGDDGEIIDMSEINRLEEKIEKKKAEIVDKYFEIREINGFLESIEHTKYVSKAVDEGNSVIEEYNEEASGNNKKSGKSKLDIYREGENNNNKRNRQPEPESETDSE